MRNRLPFLAALGLFATSALGAIAPNDARAEYERLQKWQFSTAVPLPSPVTIARDTATWTLQSGTVRAMEPAGDGTVTGFVFEGNGLFTFGVPDKYELAQLRRFANRPKLERFEQKFTQLVLRTTDANVAKLFPAASAPYAPVPLATKRHESWLIDSFEDVDARVIAAMLNPGAQQFVADMDTADFNWIRYDHDSDRPEPTALLSTDARGTEAWVSMGQAGLHRASMDHIEVKADLTKQGRTVGRQHQSLIDGRYLVDATFTGLADVTHALKLTLLPSSRELEANAENGAPLTVFRDRIGKRSINVDNRLHDDEFFIILNEPLRRGEKQRIRFEYVLETGNFAPGRSWYPSIPEAFEQKHTARLELTVRKRNELRSMGRMEKRSENDDRETSVWIVDRPTKMVTFSTATQFEEVKVAPASIPPIFSFGPDYQFQNTARLRNVAADVANSMQYFQGLLGSKIPNEQFYVTSIAAGHGQAFDGFLHMTEYTFETEHPGASELFRAHEVAHEWWGHKVGWKSYRDQWISEAFAEYCAMMFVRDFVKGGDKHFAEMLRSYEGIVKGNMAGGFSKFNRPWLIERNSGERNRLAPIGHGYRAATKEIPTGYLIQTYYKGPLVLHMLRTLLAYRTGSDDVFIKTLRDFLSEYDGKAASTEDFRRVLERNLGGSDFGWFFDAWIYRAEIPSYTWSYDVKPDGDAFLLTINLERRDVSDGFTTVIPVKVEMADGKSGFLFLTSREAKESITRKVPVRPKNVVFAPESSLLANIKRN